MSNPLMCDDDSIANLQRERDELASELALVRTERQRWAENCLKARGDRDAWNASFHAANKERIELKAERDALIERLRQTFDVRKIVGDLRAIETNAEADNWVAVQAGLRVLLRRLDESQ